MERHLAVVNNGVVTNVIVVDPNDAATLVHFGGLLLPEGSPVGIGYTYDGTNFAPPPKYATLIEAKTAKIAEIKTARDAATRANVTVSGHTWQADARSQQLLGDAITLAQAGLPLPVVWRDATNVDVPVTAIGDLLVIAGAISAQTQTAYQHSWALKAQVEAATTIAQVEAVVW